MDCDWISFENYLDLDPWASAVHRTGFRLRLEKIEGQWVRYAEQLDSAGSEEAMQLAHEALQLSRYLGEPPPEWALTAYSARFKPDVVEAAIPIWARQYVATKNPVYALLVYKSCRLSGVPVPEWVMSFFDDGVTYFQRAYLDWRREPASRHLNDPARRWAEGFGMVRRGPTIWSQQVADEAGRTFMGFKVLDVLQRQIERNGEFYITAAVSEVGARYGLSDAAAWRGWEQFKRAFPEIWSALERAPKDKMPEIFEHIANEVNRLNGMFPGWDDPTSE